MAIVGIDLGTTNSLVAIMTPDGPITLANELGDHLTPSAVAVAEDGVVLVGRAAKDRLVSAPESGRAFFKRDMGSPTTYRFGGRSWTPTECSSQVLRELKRIAESHLGASIDSAVVSVPAYFHDSQRQATVEAATIAGLKVERIINEPTAAALAFGHSNRNCDGKLMVFDLGGGTFDVTILEVFEGVVEVRASGGESRLGGEDYTDALLDHLIKQTDSLRDPSSRARLRQQVEVAKRRLANDPSAQILVDGHAVTVTREDFALITRDLTMRLRPVVRRCLRDAKTQASELKDVLLVGGASRMPMVRQYIHEDLQSLGNFSLDPDRVVALGAAVQSALCERHEAVADLVMTDVCPHTLGIEVAKEFAPGHQQPGFFSPIIDRNTTVPVSRVERYNTLHPNQDEILINIYQGESRLSAENTLLGTMRVKGLKHRPGQEHSGQIDVRFTYDMNGILEVEATILHNRMRQSHIIESRPGSLSTSDIEAAIRRLQPLKIHPRDLLPHRARVERSHRLFPELSGPTRAALTSRLDGFEAALEAQNPEEIASAGAVLDSFLAHFYADEGERQPARDRDEPDGA